jgi:hypothetical protein
MKIVILLFISLNISVYSMYLTKKAKMLRIDANDTCQYRKEFCLKLQNIP